MNVAGKNSYGGSKSCFLLNIRRINLIYLEIWEGITDELLLEFRNLCMKN